MSDTTWEPPAEGRGGRAGGAARSRGGPLPRGAALRVHRRRGAERRRVRDRASADGCRRHPRHRQRGAGTSGPAGSSCPAGRRSRPRTSAPATARSPTTTCTTWARSSTPAVGILLMHADKNVIAHNHIHHLYYTGISVGWVWGYGPSVSKANRIEFNHIHDVGQKLLSDMGGIYMLGVSPGTVVRGNTSTTWTRATYGGWGIYTDEGSTGHHDREQPRLPHQERRVPPALRQGERGPQQHLRPGPRGAAHPQPGGGAHELHVRAEHGLLDRRPAVRVHVEERPLRGRTTTSTGTRPASR